MNEGEPIQEPREDGAGVEILTAGEREVVILRADLRQRTADFTRRIKETEESGEDLPKPTKEARRRDLEGAQKEAKGAEITREEAQKFLQGRREMELKKAANLVEVFPEASAFIYAIIAKYEQAAGEDYQENLNRTKELLAGTDNIFAQAIILGTEKRASAGLTLPSLEKLAEAATSDEEILSAAALILNEDERDAFLAKLPEERRREAGMILDKVVSEVLHYNLVEEGTEGSQRKEVQARLTKELREILAQGKREERRWVKLLSEAMENLGGEDTLELFEGIALQAIKGERDPEKHRAKISQASRIIRTISQMDQEKGDNLAMKFLGKREVPLKLFVHFCRGLIRDKYLTINLEPYLKKGSKTASFLRRLIAEYPNQFNTVIDTVSQISDYDPAEHQDEVFGALKDLEAVTPIIFDRYRRAEPKERRELALQIRKLKAGFFRNQPIEDILPRKDRDILVEMVYLAYRPIGMSFEDVRRLIDRVDDSTDHLAQFKFPREGYEFDLESQTGFVLKEGQRTDLVQLKTWRDLLRPVGLTGEDGEEQKQKLSRILSGMLKATSGLNNEELALVLGLMSQDEQISNFVARYQSLTESDAYNFLNEFRENLGIYFKDHYTDNLIDFLAANPEIEQRLMQLASDPRRQKILQQQMGSDAEAIDWGRVDEREVLAQLLSQFISTKVLKGVRAGIARELNKFEENREGGQGVSLRRGLKAYISKNIGSFFAKASAGICTSKDIGLFERRDHFHINVVENEDSVRANIQAYLIDEPNGGKSLVLRGFNPNIDFEGKINVPAFCEKVLAVGRQFVADNGLQGLYITEQLGMWHALSNRTQTPEYLIGKYVKKDRERSFRLPITSSESVGKIYRV